MTNQEIFTKVYTHLHKQGKRATHVNDTCAYRGEGGTMCAVGCLIPDEAYDPVFEGQAVNAVNNLGDQEYDVEEEKNLKNRALAKALDAARIDWRDPQCMRLLNQLQAAHDTYLKTSFRPWEERSREIADEHGLIVPTLTDAA